MRQTVIAMLLALLTCTTAGAQGFPRCILAGDYADPSIMRDGQDFYMTHSAFSYSPGFLIWHSQDLVNWEPICRVVTRQVMSHAWAPDLLKHNGKYYLYYPANKKIYLCTATQIEGPWSDPVEVEGSAGIAPGHIVDQEQ